MNGRSIVVTGAGGYLGSRTAQRILETTDFDVVAWIHAADVDSARAKGAQIAGMLAPYAGRVSFAHGELGAAEPFRGIDPRGVRGFVHSAAVTRFNVDAETADEINLRGAERAFRFAERCPALEHLTYVGTLYASGLRAGEIAEAPLDDVGGFANHYERSKHAAERLVCERFSHLPWSIARVATVLADDERGIPTQQNAVHNTLKLFYYGLVSLVPGRAETPLYFVTRDLVADCLSVLAVSGVPGAVYHLCHTRAESLTLGDLISISFETFAESPGFRSRRVLEPLYVDAESFEELLGGTDAFMGDIVRQALRSISPFARQLFVTKDFRNDKMREAFPAFPAHDARGLLRATCAHLVRTRWGKA